MHEPLLIAGFVLPVGILLQFWPLWRTWPIHIRSRRPAIVEIGGKLFEDLVMIWVQLPYQSHESFILFVVCWKVVYLMILCKTSKNHTLTLDLWQVTLFWMQWCHLSNGEVHLGSSCQLPCIVDALLRGSSFLWFGGWGETGMAEDLGIQSCPEFFFSVSMSFVVKAQEGLESLNFWVLWTTSFCILTKSSVPTFPEKKAAACIFQVWKPRVVPPRCFDCPRGHFWENISCQSVLALNAWVVSLTRRHRGRPDMTWPDVFWDLKSWIWRKWHFQWRSWMCHLVAVFFWLGIPEVFKIPERWTRPVVQLKHSKVLAGIPATNHRLCTWWSAACKHRGWKLRCRVV